MAPQLSRNHRRLRCFVAMRIDDRDTDAVYDHLIAPIIRRVGLMPRRIDRLMHNERIDQRIQTELQNAQVVVADLTFARPSVYWEAGYAERQVPVVYTCRRDHFRPRADDAFGNYKVHFDLQTMNIIPWTSARDGQFSTRLERRLRYVLRPILEERAKVEDRKREEEAFAALAMANRRRRVVDSAIHYAHRHGFRGRRRDAGMDDLKFASRWFSVAHYAALLTRDGPRVAHTALVLALPKMTKSSLREIRDHLSLHPLDDNRAEQARAKRKHIADHAIVVSFGPVASDLIGETLASFERDLSLPWSAWSEVVQDHCRQGVSRRKVKMHIMSNVRSERQAHEVIKKVLLAIEASRRG